MIKALCRLTTPLTIVREGACAMAEGTRPFSHLKGTFGEALNSLID